MQACLGALEPPIGGLPQRMSSSADKTSIEGYPPRSPFLNSYAASRHLPLRCRIGSYCCPARIGAKLPTEAGSRGERLGPPLEGSQEKGIHAR